MSDNLKALAEETVRLYGDEGTAVNRLARAYLALLEHHAAAVQVLKAYEHNHATLFTLGVDKDRPWDGTRAKELDCTCDICFEAHAVLAGEGKETADV